MAINVTARVRNAMVSLTLVLSLMFTGLLFLLVYVIEDQLFVNQMKIEQASFENIIEHAGPKQIQGWQPRNANIRRIDLVENLPDTLPESVLNQVSKTNGIHEYFDDNNAMFIASLLLPDDGKRYFLVYDVKNLLVVRDTKNTLFALIGSVTLIITAVAVLLARRFSKSTLAPISHLSNALQNDDLEHVVIGLANEFSEDEISVLTRELALALERVQKSAQREYEFNRGVSHELRSPIQVAQSATELLQIYATENDTVITKTVSRLQRSVAEMNEIAEAFLWLASDRVLLEHERCSTNELQAILSLINSAFPSNDIVADFDAPRESFYRMPTAVLAVVMRSLVRNAVVHGEPSDIEVGVHEDRITVSNVANTKIDENNGFGIGLSIVQRICDRFGCQMTSPVLSEGRYSLSIVFI